MSAGASEWVNSINRRKKGWGKRFIWCIRDGGKTGRGDYNRCSAIEQGVWPEGWIWRQWGMGEDLLLANLLPGWNHSLMVPREWLLKLGTGTKWGVRGREFGGEGFSVSHWRWGQRSHWWPVIEMGMREGGLDLKEEKERQRSAISLASSLALAGVACCFPGNIYKVALKNPKYFHIQYIPSILVYQKVQCYQKLWIENDCNSHIHFLRSWLIPHWGMWADK